MNKKTGWWAVAEALAEKNARNSQGAIPKQTSTKQHSLSQQTSKESSSTEASSDSEEGIFMTLINVKNIRPNHTVVPVQSPKINHWWGGLVLDKKGLDRQKPTSLKIISLWLLIQAVYLMMRLIKTKLAKLRNPDFPSVDSWHKIWRMMARVVEWHSSMIHLLCEKTCEWNGRECRDYLCWCLTDKASDFYVLLMETSTRFIHAVIYLQFYT